MRMKRGRIKKTLLFFLISILALSIFFPVIGVIGESKDISAYDHIIVLSSYNDYSAATSIKYNLGDQIFIDMKRLDDPIGKWYLQIIDPFDRVWKSYEVGKEQDEISLTIEIPTDGIYKIQVSIPFMGEDTTIAYTIKCIRNAGRFRPHEEIDIKLPGSIDLK